MIFMVMSLFPPTEKPAPGDPLGYGVLYRFEEDVYTVFVEDQEAAVLVAV
jgi:hypothetical protein